jgi:protein-tyrosine phosphatase
MNATEPRLSVLFVCMGNICRSPTAHAVLRRRLEQLGLQGTVAVDSAGTHGYHVGHPPDERASAAARLRGYDLAGIRARQVAREDLEHSDYVLAMDAANFSALERLAESADAPRAELRLFLDFAPDLAGRDVPDPYYGARNGFEEVLDLVEQGAEALIDHMRARHGL